ncbi:hypothetical protein NSP_5290 [Nodularia spumigena CCY9414]|nr:hypothetical protein NSP_5290 [Nodularia spumigena CCY9414]
MEPVEGFCPCPRVIFPVVLLGKVIAIGTVAVAGVDGLVMFSTGIGTGAAAGVITILGTTEAETFKLAFALPAIAGAVELAISNKTVNREGRNFMVLCL